MSGKSLLLIAIGFIGCAGCRTTACAPYGPPRGPACAQGPVPVPQDGRPRKAKFSLFGPIVSNPFLAQGTGPPPLQYIYNLGVSTSQLSNTLLGGDPDESLCSRFGRADAGGVVIVQHGIVPAVDFFLGEDHCQQAAVAEQSHSREVWAWGGSGKQRTSPQVARMPHTSWPNSSAHRLAPVVAEDTQRPPAP